MRTSARGQDGYFLYVQFALFVRRSLAGNNKSSRKYPIRAGEESTRTGPDWTRYTKNEKKWKLLGVPIRACHHRYVGTMGDTKSRAQGNSLHAHVGARATPNWRTHVGHA